MILASHYIIKDVLHTLRNADDDETVKICKKYTERYKEDSEFTGLCNMLVQYIDEHKGKKAKDEKKLAGIESKLEDLSRFRVQTAASSMGLWYSERRKNI